MIKTKRLYDRHEESDGYRILVDRLWPRGIRKDTDLFDLWLKDIAPSASLRKWFNHDHLKWEQFIERYRAEIVGSEAYVKLITLMHKRKTISLLYTAKDEAHNQAQALKLIINKLT
jgi:uncharacterized protein YeaO (DUF488 family)